MTQAQATKGLHKNRQFESIIGAAHWASALVNGDQSDITTEEAIQISAWRKRNRVANVLSVEENSEQFTWSYRVYVPDAPEGVTGGNVASYYCEVKPAPRPLSPRKAYDRARLVYDALVNRVYACAPNDRTVFSECLKLAPEALRKELDAASSLLVKAECDAVSAGKAYRSTSGSLIWNRR